MAADMAELQAMFDALEADHERLVRAGRLLATRGEKGNVALADALRAVTPEALAAELVRMEWTRGETWSYTGHLPQTHWTKGKTGADAPTTREGRDYAGRVLDVVDEMARHATPREAPAEVLARLLPEVA